MRVKSPGVRQLPEWSPEFVDSARRVSCDAEWTQNGRSAQAVEVQEQNPQIEGRSPLRFVVILVTGGDGIRLGSLRGGRGLDGGTFLRFPH